MYSKVDDRVRRRLWLESLATQGVRGGYASDIQPILTREMRQPPVHVWPEVDREASKDDPDERCRRRRKRTGHLFTGC